MTPQQTNEQTVPIVDVFELVLNSASDKANLLDVGKALSSRDNLQLSLSDKQVYMDKYKDAYPSSFIDDLYEGAQNFSTFFNDNVQQLRNEGIKERAIEQLPVNRQGAEVFGIKTPSGGKHYDLITDPQPENLRPFFTDQQLASLNPYWVNKYGDVMEGQAPFSVKMDQGMIMEYTPSGLPYWRERVDGEYSYGKVAASAWGDQKKYGYNLTRDAIGGLLSGMGPETIQAAGSLTKGAYDISENIVNSINKEQSSVENGDAFEADLESTKPFKVFFLPLISFLPCSSITSLAALQFKGLEGLKSLYQGV